MKANLVLTFTSPDRPGIVEDLTRAIVMHGGNWEESRLARLCGDFAGIARISVDVSQVDALCESLQKLSSKELAVFVKRTEALPQPEGWPTAELVCSGADHEGIVSSLAARLALLGINVEEMETTVLPAPTTGTPLFQLHCRIQIPPSCDTTQLRTDLDELERELAVEIRFELGE